MITYKSTIEKPRLVITYDVDVESPREWDSLGYFITKEQRYNCPDDNEDVKKVVYDTQDDAKDTQHHIELITRGLKALGERVLYITPVTRYEHGNVSYTRGSVSGYDYSNCGFYIVTDKTRKVLGTKKKDFEKVIDSELETYTKYVNGNVYRFTLYDDDGDFEDSCGGFYDIEYIREHLPKEFANEDLLDYLIH